MKKLSKALFDAGKIFFKSDNDLLISELDTLKERQKEDYVLKSIIKLCDDRGVVLSAYHDFKTNLYKLKMYKKDNSIQYIISDYDLINKDVSTIIQDLKQYINELDVSI